MMQRRNFHACKTHHPTGAVNNNGNIRVEGEFEIYDAAGNKFDPTDAVSPDARRFRSAAADIAVKSRFATARIKPSPFNPR
jgi:hypothetical protein